ncbi:hypothetical protein ACFL4G_07080 [Thermodesulfobacteriota bacterium]
MRKTFFIITTLAMLSVFTCLGSCSNGKDRRGLGNFYLSLQQDALDFAFDDGEWLEDFGDAAAFGPAFYARAGFGSNREDYIAIARVARDYDLRTIERAAGGLFWYMNNIEEVFMAMMGFIEYAGVSGEHDLVATLDNLICTTDLIVWLFGDYVNGSVGEFAADLFGPTAITAGIALIYLQYSTYLDTPAVQRRVDRAVSILDAIDEQAFDVDHYRFDPDEDRLFLYPNAIMILVLNRLYELTGERHYLDRAELVYDGIQPLRIAGLGFYRSPYSQEYQGAQSDEYSTLSSQNYLALGLMLTYRNTGDDRYLADVLSILDHVNALLYDAREGKILHHWIDGRAALPDDPDYFCSGCNLQTLYILWYLQEELVIPLTR